MRLHYAAFYASRMRWEITFICPSELPVATMVMALSIVMAGYKKRKKGNVLLSSMVNGVRIAEEGSGGLVWEVGQRKRRVPMLICFVAVFWESYSYSDKSKRCLWWVSRSRKGYKLYHTIVFDLTVL